jgi:FdrA protein
LQLLETVKGAYYDSVTLMLVAKELDKLDGVSSSSLSMGTDANYRIMEGGGFDLSGVDASPADLIIGVRGADPAVLAEAIAAAKEYLSNPPWKKDSGLSDYRPKSLGGAVSVLPEANLAIISVAGRYAGDLAAECIEGGKNVMIFSDNVPLEKEIDLKRRAAERGLLVMGPDCGTVVIRGKALGMANAVPAGPVGIVAAAGTGLQEVHVQLGRRGVGTMHAIGVGGRDVKSDVGGLMTLLAMEALARDDEIEALLVVGKPPAADVERKILDLAKRAGKPVVFGFVGGAAKGDEGNIYLCAELEESAAVTAAVVNKTDPSEARRQVHAAAERKVDEARERVKPRKGRLRGLFTGGTLCYEAQLIASRTLGPVWSNAPLSGEMKLSQSLISKDHTIVDYGEDEFTQGRLHPMIDGSLRNERIIAEAVDPAVGVILLDLVLGYGCNRDPASETAKAAAEAKKVSGGRVAFVASVCGTDADPQNASEQIKKLEDAGVFVCSSNAQASRVAASLIDQEAD